MYSLSYLSCTPLTCVTKVPPIMLASFALQESSCKPKTIGGAGEQGLMQITKEKCTGAPGGDCLNPDFNIKTGAKYFSNTLKSNNGDLLKSIGNYNGWTEGMTYVCPISLTFVRSFTHTGHLLAIGYSCCQHQLPFPEQPRLVRPRELILPVPFTYYRTQASINSSTAGCRTSMPMRTSPDLGSTSTSRSAAIKYTIRSVQLMYIYPRNHSYHYTLPIIVVIA